MSRRSEILLAVGIFFFCVLTYFVWIPMIPLGMDTGEELGLFSPRVFPRFIVIIIAGLSVMLCFSTVKNRTVDGSDSRENVEAFINAGGVLLVGFTYIYLLEWVGYYLSTPLILFGLLWFFGARSWIKMIMATIVTTAALSLFFGKVLKVMIPAGNLF